MGEQIVEAASSHSFTDLITAHESRGEPDGLMISHLPRGPTIRFGLLNVVIRNDIRVRKTMSGLPKAHPHLIFERFNSEMSYRVKSILSHLFPYPKENVNRVITFF